MRSLDDTQAADPPAPLAVVWLNGRLVDETAATISPFDHGLLTGDGVFETVVTEERRPFAYGLHHLRLERSAAAFGLRVPDRETLLAAIGLVIEGNPHLPPRMRVRVTVTGGKSPLGSEKGTEAETVLVAASAPPPHPPVAKVVRVPWCRNERGALAGVKSTSYGENVVALAYARERGASEAIFGNTLGNLCEGSGSNVFVVRDGAVLTPPLASGCLEGVTRALVLELCGKLGIEARESDLPLSALDAAGEAFLTSTLRDVQPIGEIDGRVLPGDGETTRRLAEGMRDLKAEGF